MTFISADYDSHYGIKSYQHLNMQTLFMAQMENAAFQRPERSFSRNKKQQLRIDMTPMVDLGFLLITFFVFTTTISSPSVTELYMPNDNNVTIPSKLAKSLALTLLLDKNDRIFYYHGDFVEAQKANEVFETNYSIYSGIGNVIRQKQKSLETSGKFTDGSRGLMLIIKPTGNASYKNTVDALDEMMINDVRKHAIVEPTSEELQLLKTKATSRQ